MALSIALPSDGPLHRPALAFLDACGLGVTRASSRRYTASMRALPGATVLFQRAADIPSGLEAGLADAGIVGLDRFRESGRDVNGSKLVFPDLGFGHCSLVLGIPDSWIDVASIADLAEVSIEIRESVGDLRVGTKYPRLVSSFLLENGVSHFQLVQPSGAIEVMPGAGSADIIADITETGTTLRENRLKTIRRGEIFASRACLVVNVNSVRGDQQKMDNALTLVERMEGRLNSAEYYSVTANLRGVSPEAVAKRVLRHSDTSGIGGPTISKVYSARDEQLFAVTLAVRKDRLTSAVKLIREAGGAGITVIQPDYVFHAESRAQCMLTGQARAVAQVGPGSGAADA